MTTPCSIRKANQNVTCQVNFTVPKNMSSPVLVHYEIQNFYQNHRKYIFSRSDSQLLGSLSLASVDETYCQPLTKIGNITINPCGLIANTLFNDIIQLTSGKNANNTDLIMREDGIAWRSDVRFKYAQPKGFKYESCDCNTCACDGTIWTCKQPYFDSKTSTCYRYSYPQDDTTQYLYETFPMVINPIEGVKNEHFIVWMRVAAAPTFRKLYGYFNEQIPAGETLTFTIHNNWDVSSFKGAKSLVLSTTTPFGGRNPSLGYSFIGVGGFCFIAGVFFVLKQVIRPRKLADKKYLKYKEE